MGRGPGRASDDARLGVGANVAPVYAVHLPAEESVDGARYICRFRHAEEDLSGAIAYTPGETYRSGGRLRWLDDRTVAWIEERGSDGGSRAVTPRGRIGLSGQAAKLTLDDLFAPVAAVQGLDPWLGRIDMARWIVSPATEERLASLVRHLSRRLPRHRPSSGTLLEALVSVYRGRGPNDGSRVLDVLFYLDSYNRLLGITAGMAWDDLRHSPSDQVQDQLVSLSGELALLDRLPLCAALRVAIESVVHGRRAGSRVAASLRSLPGIEDVLVDEVGALSYGSVPDAVELPPPNFVGIDNYDFTPAQRPTILYSGNPAFFRAYLTRLTSTIIIFPEFDFHVLLLGDEPECVDFAAAMRHYVEESATVRRQPLVSNLTMSWAKVPHQVTHAKSYFASARFIFAHEHLDAFPEGLWIHDVDLYPTADITPFLSDLRRCDVGISVSRLQAGLLPWKRYLAGNVFLNDTPGTRAFLAETSRYLRHWLASTGTWMVDQNALSWAAERSPHLAIVDMLTARVPLVQSTLAGRIERHLP